MTSKAQLIYKSYMTYFHTFLPVYFYGMPNGKVYCMYARFNDSISVKSGLEFVFAEHEDFSYEYQSGKISGYGQTNISLGTFKQMVDQPEPRIRNINTNSGFQSYAEAQFFLEHNPEMRISNFELEKA
jgi:hypothetical protein